jgi:hypothetical protein
MRSFSLLIAMALMVGCGSNHNAAPSTAKQSRQPAAPADHKVVLEVDPAWTQFVQANFQKRVRAILIDNPDSVVFPATQPTIEALYSPETGTDLTAQGPVQYRDAAGQLRDGVYFVRWQTPARASGPNVQWKPGFVSISQEATPPTTTVNPSVPVTQ